MSTPEPHRAVDDSRPDEGVEPPVVPDPSAVEGAPPAPEPHVEVDPFTVPYAMTVPDVRPPAPAGSGTHGGPAPVDTETRTAAEPPAEAPGTPQSPLLTTRGAAARAAAAHAAERPSPTPPGGTSDVAPPPPARGFMSRANRSSAAPLPAAVPPPPSTSPRVPARPADAATPAATTDGTVDKPVEPPEPVAPRSARFGGHVLGTLVGLLFGLLAVTFALVGQGRILAAQVDAWDASLDVPGIVLVAIGVVVLAALVALGAWTAAVPLAAGTLLTALGSVFLFAPGIARNTTMRWFATESSHDTVTRATVAGTSGTILLLGLVVLAAGVALVLARRRGRELGEFREKYRTP